MTAPAEETVEFVRELLGQEFPHLSADESAVEAIAVTVDAFLAASRGGAR